MFTLHVLSDNLDFLTYLRQESTFDANQNAFVFTTVEQASLVIARYTLYVLKETHFLHMTSETSLEISDKHELFLYLSEEKMAKIYHYIYEKTVLFLSQHPSFDFEGFVRFRLALENATLAKCLWIAYHDFLEYSSESSNIDFLKMLLEEHSSQIERISVIGNEDGSFRIEYNDSLYLEQEREEDTLLSHIIHLSPRYVDVYETVRPVSPPYAIILTKLFEKRVIFHGLEDGSSSHQKTKK